MPRVPFASESVESVPLQGGQIRLPQFADPTHGLAGALDDVSRVAEGVLVETQLTAAKEIDAETRKQISDLGMAEGGFFTLNGRDAVDGFREFEANLDKIREDAIKRSGGGRVGQHVTASLEGYVENERNRARSHALAQREVWEAAASNARQGQSEEDVARFWNDREMVVEQLGIIENEVLLRATSAGLDDPEILAQGVMQAQSRALLGAIDLVIAQDPRRAEEFLATYAPLLDSNSLARAQNDVERATLAFQVQDETDSIIGQTVTRDASLTMARGIEDPEIRKSVRIEINAWWDQKAQADRLRAEAIEQSDLQGIREGRITKRAQLSDELSRVSFTGLAKLIDSENAGPVIKTDPKAFAKWQTMMPEELAKQIPIQWIGKLDTADWERFTSEVGDARNEATGALAETIFGGVVRDDVKNLVREQADSLGIDRSTKAGEEDVRRLRTLSRAIWAAADREKPETREELVKLADQVTEHLTTQMVVDEDVVFDDTLRRIDVTGETKIGDIPPRAEEKIRTLFEARGVANPTDEQLQAAYGRQLQKLPQRRRQRPFPHGEFSPLTDRRVGTTEEGRTIFENEDGSRSSERTVTVEDERLGGGRPTLIPTIFNGHEVGVEEAIRIIADNDGRDPETGLEVPTFASNEEADEFARRRSQSLR